MTYLPLTRVTALLCLPGPAAAADVSAFESVISDDVTEIRSTADWLLQRLPLSGSDTRAAWVMIDSPISRGAVWLYRRDLLGPTTRYHQDEIEDECLLK